MFKSKVKKYLSSYFNKVNKTNNKKPGQVRVGLVHQKVVLSKIAGPIRHLPLIHEILQPSYPKDKEPYVCARTRP